MDKEVIEVAAETAENKPAETHTEAHTEPTVETTDNVGNLVDSNTRSITGIFTVRERIVKGEDGKPSRTMFKCECIKPSTRKPGTLLKVGAWIDVETGTRVGLKPGMSFEGRFSYESAYKSQDAGQFLEEWTLSSCLLKHMEKGL